MDEAAESALYAANAGAHKDFEKRARRAASSARWVPVCECNHSDDQHMSDTGRMGACRHATSDRRCKCRRFKLMRSRRQRTVGA